MKNRNSDGNSRFDGALRKKIIKDDKKYIKKHRHHKSDSEKRPVNTGMFADDKTQNADNKYILGLAVIASMLFVITTVLFVVVVMNDGKIPFHGEDIPAVITTDDDETETSVPPNDDSEAPTVQYPYTTNESRTSYAISDSSKIKDISSDKNISADYCALVDLDTYTLVAKSNADVRIYPASMTKIMTLIVACENIRSLDEKVTISKKILDYVSSQGASVAGFDEGDIATVEDLLYGISLSSGADAVIALAEHISGSEKEFVKLMNEKARSMGLSKTNFVNATGLHDDMHYTTCREMAQIMAYALDNELCKKLLSTVSYEAWLGYYDVNNIYKTYRLTFYSTLFVKRMESISPNQPTGLVIKAGKTGYTTEAKSCLATFASGTKGSYILVTAKGSTSKSMITDYMYIYNNFAE